MKRIYNHYLYGELEKEYHLIRSISYKKTSSKLIQPFIFTYCEKEFEQHKHGKIKDFEKKKHLKSTCKECIILAVKEYKRTQSLSHRTQSKIFFAKPPEV